MIRLQWRRVRARYPWLQILQTWRCWLVVSFCVLLIIYVVVALQKRPVTFLEEEIKEIWLGNIEFDFQTGLYFLKDEDEVYLRGSMPDALQMSGPPNHCGKYNKSEYLCASWYPNLKLEVTNQEDEHASCHGITWTPAYSSHTSQTCFSVSDYFWYGGSLLYNQTWPLNIAKLNLQGYRSHDMKYYKGKDNTVGNVLDWYWLSSAGIAVILDDKYSVKISMNQFGDNLLCFYGQAETKSILKYRICKAANLRKIHRYIISKTVHLPVTLPEDSIFTSPLWTSNPLFPSKSVNQNSILKYAKDVTDHGFARHGFEIYDEELLLSLNPNHQIMNQTKFPNAHQTLMLLSGDYNFKTYLSITPFVKVQKDLDDNHLKLMCDKNAKPITAIWNGENVNIVNLLSEQGFQWFLEKLKDLKTQFGLEGFRLLGGEYDHLSNILSDADHDMIVSFSQKFSSLAEGLKFSSISTFASRSQKSAGMILLSSHESTWDSNGGLRSIIPSVLTLGVLGYPYVITNIAGGPGTRSLAVNGSISVQKPDEELFVRWVGLAAYMPVMMFSFPPWLYSKNTLETTQQFVKIHEETVAPLVIKAAREYDITGSPIIRPLWWIDPIDITSQKIGDEFLIGESLLVAPVLHQGKRERDIYIPKGHWLDTINNIEIEGQTWLRNYKVALHQVATFSNVKK